MVKITAQTIGHLGQLARIGLSKTEVKQLQTDVASILSYVNRLQAVNTSKTAITSQVTGLVDIWRDDTPYRQTISPAELLKNAPAQEDGYIKVKKVL